MREIHGRVGSLLEVGTGFHPELTGRENIYLNGAILGMRRTEIAARFDEIVAFAEVERFLDTAVKHYSDGMYLRLAFAVAAHLEPDILLVDEVLAVGDARFQRKCLGKMSDIAERRAGRSLVVSHNMGAIQRLCDRSLLLEGGRLVDAGPTAADRRRVPARRVRASGPRTGIDVSAAARGGAPARCSSSVPATPPATSDDRLPAVPGRPARVRVKLQADEPRVVPSFGVVFRPQRDEAGERRHPHLGRGTASSSRAEHVVLTIDRLHLKPGSTAWRSGPATSSGSATTWWSRHSSSTSWRSRRASA